MANYFISRAGEDHEWGVWMAQVLEDAGHTCFLQDHDIAFGDDFVEQMKKGMERCDHVIAILSPDHLRKEHTSSELNAAYAFDPLGKKRMLLLVRVRRPCEIPKIFAHLVYLDLYLRDDEARRMLIARIDGTHATRKATYRTFISKLPTVNPTLIGRVDELAFLDRAWSDPAANLVQVIAAGGTGKTALMDKWFRRHVEEATVFGWSFYSQGTSENRQTSSDPFFTEIIGFLKITIEPTASIYAKAEAIADRLRNERVLLILDGVEPLQDSSGALRDQALKALLEELATRNKGLVLCTTRLRLADLPDDEPRVSSIDLDNLFVQQGADYLAFLGVEGTVEELCEASDDYGGHALALTLLGTYLVDFCDADIRRRIEIPGLVAEGAGQMMEGYARMYAGKPELEILRAMGYFDRPAEPEALKLVLPAMPDRAYRSALNSLTRARLILDADPKAPIDCHPLVREHFARTASAEGHSRLYEHYCRQAPHRPDTLEEMTPLFYAVYHGCRAGRHQSALGDVYHDRILRGDDFYLFSRLGAFGTNLSLLANFFESPWSKPAPSLSPADQSWVMVSAAFALRVLGRLALADAVEPMKAGALAYVKQADWKSAAMSYNNLSGLQLTLGNVAESISAARESVELADRSQDNSKRSGCRARLADALHQSGDFSESSNLFEEAERLQGESQPDYKILHSLRGYRYCDLLLTVGETLEVVRRATETLKIAERYEWLLDIGLDHLSLGRVGASATHLNKAIDHLRRSGRLDLLPLALLARGTQRDLDEVYKIATRSGMRLYLADYHIAMARLHKSLDHLSRAETLVAETGYHRRDPELAALRQAL